MVQVVPAVQVARAVAGPVARASASLIKGSSTVNTARRPSHRDRWHQRVTRHRNRGGAADPHGLLTPHASVVG